MQTMDKKEYFLKAFQHEKYLSRSWLIRCFGNPVYDFYPDDAWDVGYQDGKFFTVDENEEFIQLTGNVDGERLYTRDESVTLEAGDLPNITEKTKTAYSSAMFNIYLFIWPYKTPFPYIATRFGGKDVDKLVEEALREGTITTQEYTKRHTQAMQRLTAFMQLFVTAATEKSIRPSKRAIKVRDELLKKYKDELSDPAILALIDQTVTAVDKEDMKGDEAERFFLKGKAYATVRKKMFTLQGGIVSLEDSTKMDLLPTSLEEGIRPEDFPVMVNNLRSGSYSRAKDTALGGEAAKFAARVFQNTKISNDDCGSKIGRITRVRSDNYAPLKGRYLPGSDEPLTVEAAKKLVGKEVILRDPATCREPNNNFCVRCIGETIANSKVSITSLMNAQGNVYMSVALAAFHGSSLKTVKVKASDYIR